MSFSRSPRFSTFMAKQLQFSQDARKGIPGFGEPEPKSDLSAFPSGLAAKPNTKAPPGGHALQETLAQAVARLGLFEPSSDEYAQARAELSERLGQGNTYCTWSLSLKQPGTCDALMLYSAAADEPDVRPSALGVTASSTPAFLKALDLGGGDQRALAGKLPDDVAAAEELLVGNKKGDVNRCYILTGGPLAARQKNCAMLGAAFPHMTFVTIHPEDEGRLTLRASEGELARLVASSAGKLTHALLMAKGSTDLHMAWLDSAGVATAAGCAMSAVHRAAKGEPSCAADLFHEFLGRPANAALAGACAAGRCAIVFAGASIHMCGGKAVAATGNYFRRLARAELEAADAAKADFERHVGLEWNAERACPIFIGAIGPVKPRLDAQM